MPFLHPGNMNVQVIFESPGGRSAQVACGMSAVDFSSETAADIGTAIAESDYVTLVMSAAWHITAIRYSIGTSDPSAPIVFETAADVEGGGSSGGISPNVALLVEKHTALGGRHGRGRSFFPGLTEDAVGPDGNLTGDVAIIQAAGADFWQVVNDAAGSPAPLLLHSLEEPDPTEIVGFVTQTKVATQRRRLRA